MSNRKYMGLVLMMGSVYSLVIAFHTIAPFLIQSTLNYSSIFFGKLSLIMGVFFLFATFLCRFLLSKFKAEKLFLFSTHIFLFCSLLTLLNYNYSNNVYIICTISALMFFANGFIYPLSSGTGLSIFRQMAGTATAFMYFINVLISSIVGFGLGFVIFTSPLVLYITYVILMLFCVLIFWVFVYKKNNN